MMNGKGKLGKAGEEEVCKWLISKGHTILERNWRAGKQEIDIISLDRDGIHFVEVKSRTAPVQGEPEEAVNPAKQRNIVKAARRYMTLKGNELSDNLEIWFDIAAVTFDGGDVRLNYFPGAFVPIYV
ncbi:MAG: YraN family protein [Candidatus Cryptobacteroides sp.]